MTSLCQDVAQGMGELFTCSQMDGQVRIRTPYLYPDGDVIDLFLREKTEPATLTDLGETLRWLRMQTVSLNRSPKQKQLIEDICMTHGVEFFRGMLLVRLRSRDQISSAVTRLSQAAIRVADLWFTFRTRSVETITDEVADLLTEKHISFERGEPLVGRSGRVWRPDFHTRLPNRSTLINVLSTGSRAAARGITEHVVASWYDLSHITVGPEGLRFLSLFDDTLDVWSPGDFKLVEPLSTVALWSRPDEFLVSLEAA